MVGPTTLKCSETVYDASGYKAHDVPHYFILEEESFFRRAKLRWENLNLDLALVTYNPARIEGAGGTKAYMPAPKQIDQCIKAGLVARPELRKSDGEVNYPSACGGVIYLGK